MRDRGRLFIFYPKTSQLPVWDTDVNRCCGFFNFDFKRSENTVDPSYTHIQCGFVLHGIWTAV